jgi:hypothetical protein
MLADDSFMSTIRMLFQTIQNASIERFFGKSDVEVSNKSGVSCDKCCSQSDRHPRGVSL